jgi:hypothetical protein
VLVPEQRGGLAYESHNLTRVAESHMTDLLENPRHEVRMVLLAICGRASSLEKGKI